LNPSATDAIQNFLNLSFKICSFCASSSAEPVEGMKDGIVAAGGGGEGDLRLDANCICCVWSGTVVCCGVVKGFEVGLTEESELESESDSEEEDEDSIDSFAAFFAVNGLLDFGTSSADEDEESEDEDDDEEEAARLFLFLLRFLPVAGTGAMVVVVDHF
jgi:hypothetical protein